MKIVHFIAATALVASAITPSIGFAQEADQCTCVSPRSDSNTAGTFVSTRGTVKTTGDSDYIDANAGTPILNGAEISVSSNSAADIRVGSCRLSLEENSLTRVSTLENGNLCVASAGPPAPGPGLPTNLGTLPLFLGLAGGAAALSLLDDGIGQGGSPVSP